MRVRFRSTIAIATRFCERREIGAEQKLILEIGCFRFCLLSNPSLHKRKRLSREVTSKRRTRPARVANLRPAGFRY